MSTKEHPLFGFSRFAIDVANKVGSAGAFFLALAVIAIWAITGPIFHYSDTWQLWINTGTTIITFLMVFLIQYTQNRDARARMPSSAHVAAGLAEAATGRGEAQ